MKMAKHYEHALNVAANNLIQAAMAVQAIVVEQGSYGGVVVQNNYITVHISHREPRTKRRGNPIRVNAV